MRSIQLAAISTLALAALGAMGCGGGDSFCGSFELTACGGDVVGAWSSEHVCPSPTVTETDSASEEYPGCAPTNVMTQRTTLAGVELTMNADGTYALTSSSIATFELSLDRTCAGLIAAEDMPGATLEQLCDFFEQQAPGASGGSCTVAGDVCHCDLTGSSSDEESGTYTVSGNELTLSSGQPMPYCVEGNQLSVQLAEPLDGQTATYLVLER